jgi:uncharacterized membrane protein YagU involved in acid resistance
MRGNTYEYYDDFEDEGSYLGTFLMMIVGGLCALAAFDAFGQLYSPEAGYPKLAPVPLATQSLGALFGEEFKQYGTIAHYAMGIIGYPLGYALIARPISRLIAPRLHWWVVGIVFGVVIWAFALYVMAHLVSGNPPFLGFSTLTWVALVGHIVYGLVLAAVMRRGAYA